MRLAATGTLAFLFVQMAAGPAQQQRPLPGAISGVVQHATSGDPIPKAQVTLTRVLPPPVVTPGTPVPITPVPPIPPVMTDSDGKFAFTDLEPGNYRISAGRNGFVRMNFGERYSGGPGTIVVVPAGQTLKDTSFRLMQTATISGRVREASGEPAAGYVIQLLKPSYSTVGRTFQTISTERTDDRGEYRMFWISPGRYYLAVASNRNSLSILALEGLIVTGGGTANEIPSAGPTVFYPGVVDPGRATTIDVGAGRELAGVDVLLPQQPLYRVRGRVVDVNGQPPRTASIQLIPRGTSIPSLSTSIVPNYNATTGTFDLRDVVPGTYWLRAQASESTATATISANLVGRTVSEALSSVTGTRTAAQIPLDVSGDIEGIVLSMTPGLTVSGVVRVEGTALPTTSSPRIALRTTAQNGLSSSAQPINADGTFTITNIFAGEYRLTVLAMPTDYYIKEARIEQTDVLNQPWVISTAIRGTLEVVLSSAAGQIEGTVVDARALPISSIQTVLIPDQDRVRTELFKTAVTDQNGRFTFRGITPGNYRIFAWEGLEANSYFDPDVLSQYEQQGKTIRVAEAGKHTAEVKMIPAKAQ
jgi:hypothetical protein